VSDEGLKEDKKSFSWKGFSAMTFLGIGKDLYSRTHNYATTLPIE
jgi:hypothetical protein